ncbi:SDR family oxidoreductase [Flindersiella endophytica]
MRVFVTGASGFVGSAVVRELIGNGHQVLGLARTDAAEEALKAAGAEPHRGDLADLDSLRGGAAQADGVIHLAYSHDFSQMAAAAETDRQAIEAIGEVLAGTGRPFVVTGGTGVLGPGRVVTEEDAPPEPWTHPRRTDQTALPLAERGVRVSLVRLPQVHGEGDHGFVPYLIQIARTKGVAAYLGDGSNRWPAVHRLDAARLYRLALEHAPAGARLHAVAEEGIPARAIAEVFGKHLGLPVRAIPDAEAEDHFGWIRMFASQDLPASGALTQERFDWKPEQIGLIADLEAGHYFG